MYPVSEVCREKGIGRRGGRTASEKIATMEKGGRKTKIVCVRCSGINRFLFEAASPYSHSDCSFFQKVDSVLIG